MGGRDPSELEDFRSRLKPPGRLRSCSGGRADSSTRERRVMSSTLRLRQAFVVSLVIALVTGCGSSDSSTERDSESTTVDSSTEAGQSITAPAVTDSVPDTTPASPSADGADAARGSIVVQAPAGQGDGIYLLAPDGGLGDRLDKDAQSSKHPDWSADGTTVVYSSDTDGALWTTTIGGAGPERLIACDDGCLALDFPAFSPDGTLSRSRGTSSPTETALPPPRRSACSTWPR